MKYLELNWRKKHLKKGILFTAVSISLILIGCSNSNPVTEEKQPDNKTEDLVEEITELKEIIATQEEEIEALANFSYLNEFSEEELRAYDLFLENYDVTHLKEYPPEKIILLYLHSLTITDLQMTYAITYNGGTLPDFETFSELFRESELDMQATETVLINRNYDSIAVREEHQAEENVLVEVDVEVNVSFGIYSYSTIYNVQKENNQWKISLQHWFDSIS